MLFLRKQLNDDTTTETADRSLFIQGMFFKRRSIILSILGTRAVKIRASDTGHPRNRFGDVVTPLSAIIERELQPLFLPFLLHRKLFSSRDERFPATANTWQCKPWATQIMLFFISVFPYNDKHATPVTVNWLCINFFFSNQFLSFQLRNIANILYLKNKILLIHKFCSQSRDIFLLLKRKIM